MMKQVACNLLLAAVIMTVLFYSWLYYDGRVFAKTRSSIELKKTKILGNFTALNDFSQSALGTYAMLPSNGNKRDITPSSSTITSIHYKAAFKEPSSRRIAVNSIEKVVFYNRIGKCGSRSLIATARTIARFNNVTVTSSSDFWNSHPDETSMNAEMVKISQLLPSTFYDRHIHFLDFEKHGLPSPIYINMVRDPASRFQSHLNYVQYGDKFGKVKNPLNGFGNLTLCVMNDEPLCRDPHYAFYIGMYFCGFDPVCSDTTSHKRVELAKKHIDENYLVIGVLEDFENTLRLFEKMIPGYFRAARQGWKRFGENIKSKSKTKLQDILSNEAIEKLKKDILADEYSVYDHVVAKYERQKRQHGIYS